MKIEPIESELIIKFDKKSLQKAIKELDRELKGLQKDIKIRISEIDRGALKKASDQVINETKKITEKAVIKPKVEIDLSAERAKFNQIQKVARDTGVQIDQDLKSKLEIETAQATLALKQIRSEIRQTTDKDQLIKLNIEARGVQSALTETKRGLNNLQNTGEKSLSRLQSKFDGVRGAINANGLALQSLIRGDVIGGIQGLGTAFNTAGAGAKGLLLALGPITIALGAFALLFSTFGGTARSFETAFTGVEKVVKGSTEDIATLRKQLEGLSKELPNSFENLSAIAESGARLGVPIDQIAEFTRVVAGLEVATGVAAEEIATDFARIANITGLPLSEVGKLGSALTALGNNFATSEREIIGFSNRIAGAGNLVGITAQELFGIATAFTSVGLTAEAGGSSVSKAFLAINNAVATGGEELDKFAAISGKTADEFSTIFREDATEAFTLFVEGLGAQGDNAGVALESVLGKSSELQRTFLSLAGNTDVLRDAVNLANQSFDENVALQNEVNVRLQTSDSRLAILQNRWRLLGSSIGQAINNVAVPALEVLTNIFFNSLPRAFFSTIRVLETLSAVFDTVIGSLPELGKTAITGLARVFQKGFVSIAKGAASLAGALGLTDLQNSINNISFTKIQIDTGGIDAFQANYTKRLDQVNKKEADFFAQSNAIQAQAVDQQRKVLQDQTQEELDALKSILEGEKATAKGRADARSGGGDTSQADFAKTFEEEEKAFRDLQQIKKNLVEAEKQFRADASKFITDQAISAYKEVEKNIDQSTKKIEDYNKQIEKLQTDLGSLETATEGSLASRVVQIQKELEGDNLSLEKQVALQEELALATANTTQEEIARQQALADETATDRILREAEEKKLALELQLQEATKARDAEIAIVEGLQDEKANLEKKYTQVVFDESEKRKQQEIAVIDELKKRYQDLQAERAKAFGGGTIALGGSETNGTQPITQTSTINVTVDGVQDPGTVKIAVREALTEQAREQRRTGI